MHILLIEDDQDAAAWFAKDLRESGHLVDQAADGDEGLYLALTGEPLQGWTAFTLQMDNSAIVVL